MTTTERAALIEYRQAQRDSVPAIVAGLAETSTTPRAGRCHPSTGRRPDPSAPCCCT
ncbi:MAG TPA: hypothetical protein VK020_16860 [Microlunatus sp.]|nr:hypothetical protein [Microlunatus sp.]